MLATYFRGCLPGVWISSSDQIVTLSLFYTGDISREECESRFVHRGYVSELYDDDGELKDEIRQRYRELIALLKEPPDLIEGAGNFKSPADPTFTACRLTTKGTRRAAEVIGRFPSKPDFPNWPDKRTLAELSE